MYVEDKTKEFDKSMEDRLSETNRKYKELIQISLQQLSQDTKEAADKIKEIKEKGVTTEAEQKIELLENRIRLFEDIGMPNDPKLLYSKAMVYIEKRKFNEALKLLERAVELDKGYKSAYWQIGWVQYKLKNYEESQKAYGEAIKLEPKDSSAYNNTGASLRAAGKNEEALNYFNKAIEISPENSQYYRNKAAVLDCLRRYEEALQSINKAIDIDPSSSGFYLYKGRILSKMDKAEDSMKSYEKAGEIMKLEVNKPSVEEGNLLNFFENLIMIGHYEEAVNFKLEIQKENKIKSENYLAIFEFLIACLSFMQKNSSEGYKLTYKLIEGFKNYDSDISIGWDFVDINIPLKLGLKDNLYQTCIILEKILLREISIEMGITQIKNLEK